MLIEINKRFALGNGTLSELINDKRLLDLFVETVMGGAAAIREKPQGGDLHLQEGEIRNKGYGKGKQRLTDPDLGGLAETGQGSKLGPGGN